MKGFYHASKKDRKLMERSEEKLVASLSLKAKGAYLRCLADGVCKTTRGVKPYQRKEPFKVKMDLPRKFK